MQKALKKAHSTNLKQSLSSSSTHWGKKFPYFSQKDASGTGLNENSTGAVQRESSVHTAAATTEPSSTPDTKGCSVPGSWVSLWQAHRQCFLQGQLPSSQPFRILIPSAAQPCLAPAYFRSNYAVVEFTGFAFFPSNKSLNSHILLRKTNKQKKKTLQCGD